MKTDRLKLSSEMIVLAEACKPFFADKNMSLFLELIQAGEFGVALEFASEWLYDAKQPISVDLVEQIEQLGTTMNLKPSVWLILRGKSPYR